MFNLNTELFSRHTSDNLIDILHDFKNLVMYVLAFQPFWIMWTLC